MSDPTDNIDPFVTQESASPEAQPTSQDPFADQLSSIVNEEGKVKYDSVGKALDGLKNAQEYIPQLKSELAKRDEELNKLREELSKRQSVEEVVSRLQPVKEEVQETPVTPQSEGFSEEAVAKLFETYMSQKEQETALKTNRQKVNSALSSMYGENASKMVAEKASQLGLTTKEFGDMANTKPDLVLALFNAKPTTTSVSTSTSSINIPPTQVKPTELSRPEKSLLSGATSREQAEFMRKIQADIYAKFGITE